MQDKVIYEYVVIRVVPRVEREEFLNVGVVVYARRRKYLDIKYKIDEKRLKAFSADIDIDLLNSYLNAWTLVCRGGAEGGDIGQMEMAYRFRWLAAYRSTIIQSSRIHPGLCDNPEEVLEKLFAYYVL
jgi:hypothetical protein